MQDIKKYQVSNGFNDKDKEKKTILAQCYPKR